MVKCVDSKNLEVYRDFHLLLAEKEEVHKKVNKPKSIKRPNVLILGVDSVSRLNIYRTMPYVTEYMTREGWLEMQGYNKIDDNTLPNFSAMLTGLTYDMLVKTPGCRNVRTEPFDNCSFIWKDFSQEGFVTAYGEEAASISTFNKYHFGFYKPPTDYYPRPFFISAEDHSGSFDRDDVHMCLGSKLAVDHILNFTKEFSVRFNTDQFFGFFWLNSLSHSYLNLPTALDIKFLELFQELKSKTVLEHTFVVFLSDHGRRFGAIAKTDIGWLEERLPFLFTWVPESYRKLHPEKYLNMQQNARKLVTPFDFHLTLKDILYGVQLQGTASCPKCVSMFAKMPEDRSCEDASIPQHWCACTQYEHVSLDTVGVREAIEFIFTELNTKLNQGRKYLKLHHECAHLTLDEVESVKQRVNNKPGSGQQLLVSFRMSPGGGFLRATVGKSTAGFRLLGTVSRLDSFGKQSWCMNDPELQKYCVCI